MSKNEKNGKKFSKGGISPSDVNQKARSAANKTRNIVKHRKQMEKDALKNRQTKRKLERPAKLALDNDLQKKRMEFVERMVANRESRTAT